MTSGFGNSECSAFATLVTNFLKIWNFLTEYALYPTIGSISSTSLPVLKAVIDSVTRFLAMMCVIYHS